MPLFLIFIIFNNHSHSTIIHSFILHHSPRPVFLYPHRASSLSKRRTSMRCRAETSLVFNVDADPDPDPYSDPDPD
jgi:hypothetical protein